MDITMLAICIGIVVAVYNLFLNLRGNRKQKKQDSKYVLKALGKSLVLGVLAFVVVVSIDLETEENTPTDYEADGSVSVDFESEESVPTVYETEERTAVAYETVSETEYKYTFRSEELLMDHYEKHGIFMKYKGPEQYQNGANRVIADADTLHAVEAEDGDDVYYLEQTNEFVVVSTDGYIRTYFCPEDGIDYFHRQSE